MVIMDVNRAMNPRCEDIYKYVLRDMCVIHTRGSEYGRAKAKVARFFNFTEASSDFHRVYLMNVCYKSSATGARLESDKLRSTISTFFQHRTPDMAAKHLVLDMGKNSELETNRLGYGVPASPLLSSLPPSPPFAAVTTLARFSDGFPASRVN